MIVESVSRWVWQEAAGEPISLAEWQRPSARDGPYRLLNGHFIFVYGLYSPHGRSHLPYNPIPDVTGASC
jgi:hypothetical protein